MMSSFVRCVLKALLPVVVVFFSSLKAEQCFRKLLFHQVTKGDRLTTNVISSYDVASSMNCGQQCLQQMTCVAFNYRSKKKSNEPNCQLTNSTEGFEENGAKNNVGDWTFHKALDAVLSPCSKNPCKNGGKCVPNVCQPKGFSCKCGVKHMGELCEVDKVFKSCQDALDNASQTQDGVYKIKTETTTGSTNVYCQMTLLPGCSGGGWTMVMKMNGSKDTFEYSSTYWSDKQIYNLPGGMSAFDDQETKLPTYWSTSFNELCVGMKLGNDLNIVNISYTASSLYSLIADGNYRSINVGRVKWKSLITGSSLQRNCNKEGFNVPSSALAVRLGILGNNEDQCSSVDSFIGYGGKKRLGIVCGIRRDNTAGNLAMCNSDNGNKNSKVMGYILVR